MIQTEILTRSIRNATDDKQTLCDRFTSSSVVNTSASCDQQADTDPGPVSTQTPVRTLIGPDSVQVPPGGT